MIVNDDGNDDDDNDNNEDDADETLVKGNVKQKFSIKINLLCCKKKLNKKKYNHQMQNCSPYQKQQLHFVKIMFYFCMIFNFC